jgi:hypothetical protein
MLDPNNPFASPQPTGFEGLETFDPFGGTGISTSASFYAPGCGPGTTNENCYCV